VASLARDHEGRDARRVGLEREDEHLVHETDVLVVGDSTSGLFREALGRLDLSGRRDAPGGGEPALDVAHARHVLVELAAIAPAEHAFEPARVLADEVEDARPAREPPVEPALTLAGRAAPEEAIEHAARIDLLRHGRLGARPTDVVRV